MRKRNLPTHPCKGPVLKGTFYLQCRVSLCDRQTQSGRDGSFSPHWSPEWDSGAHKTVVHLDLTSPLVTEQLPGSQALRQEGKGKSTLLLSLTSSFYLNYFWSKESQKSTGGSKEVEKCSVYLSGHGGAGAQSLQLYLTLL